MRPMSFLLQAIAVLGALYMVNPATSTVSAQQPEKQVQKSELGMPPGAVNDMEDTRKQPDLTTMHSPESNQQVTLGGAQSFVDGEILKIDGQSFDIRRADSSERVRVLVNQDTNIDCATAPISSDGKQSDSLASDRMSDQKQAPTASERQVAQGQRKNETARGAGFQIGQCNFHPGDRVKAEVDDMGRVTTIKYLAGSPPTARHAIGETAGTGELAMPGRQEKPGQLDMTGAGGSMPTDYAILPVPVGEITTTQSNVLLKKPVKDPQGKTVGTLENFIVDAHSGRIEYAILAIENGTHLHPVPWSAIQLRRDSNNKLNPTIDTSKYQIMPSLMRDQSMDLSPPVKELVMEMNVLRAREPQKSQTRESFVKEPAIGGPMGEDKAGGGGLSGERGLPPEKDAPGFKREKDKRD